MGNSACASPRQRMPHDPEEYEEEMIRAEQRQQQRQQQQNNGRRIDQEADSSSESDLDSMMKALMQQVPQRMNLSSVQETSSAKKGNIRKTRKVKVKSEEKKKRLLASESVCSGSAPILLQEGCAVLKQFQEPAQNLEAAVVGMLADDIQTDKMCVLQEDHAVLQKLEDSFYAEKEVHMMQEKEEMKDATSVVQVAEPEIHVYHEQKLTKTTCCQSEPTLKDECVAVEKLDDNYAEVKVYTQEKEEMMQMKDEEWADEVWTDATDAMHAVQDEPGMRVYHEPLIEMACYLSAPLLEQENSTVSQKLEPEVQVHDTLAEPIQLCDDKVNMKYEKQQLLDAHKLLKAHPVAIEYEKKQCAPDIQQTDAAAYSEPRRQIPHLKPLIPNEEFEKQDEPQHLLVPQIPTPQISTPTISPTPMQTPTIVAPKLACDPDSDPTLVHFSAYAPPSVEAGEDFTLNLHAFMKIEHAAVVRDEAAIGNEEAGINGPFRVQIGETIQVVLDGLPHGLTTDDNDATIVWGGVRAKFSFYILCSKKIKVNLLKCKANIFVNNYRVGVLIFTIHTVPKLPFYKSFMKAIMPKKPVVPSTHKVGPVPPPKEDRGMDIGATVTLLPFKNSPHIFLSYRRSHHALANCIRMIMVNDYGYECFMDMDEKSGLGVGNFQDQLENALQNCKVMIPIFTPAPSGTDEVRKHLSSVACMKEYERRGETDYCQVEISKALDDKNKIIIPVASGVGDIGTELKNLPTALAALAKLNARELHNDMFPQSVDVVHMLIQRKMQDLIRAGAM